MLKSLRLARIGGLDVLIAAQRLDEMTTAE
jgi:hypothetical protein